MIKNLDTIVNLVIFAFMFYLFQKATSQKDIYNTIYYGVTVLCLWIGLVARWFKD